MTVALVATSATRRPRSGLNRRAAGAVAILGLISLLPGCSGPGLSSKLCGAPKQPCCASRQCGEGAVCGTSGSCVSCGAKGTVCCAGSACGDGLVCGPSGSCLSCGAEGSACCQSGACGDGLVCGAAGCVKALSCATNCTVGSTRCSNDGAVEACRADGPCPEWSTLVAECPTGTHCAVDGGVADCATPCPGACAVSAVYCTVDGEQRCTQGPTDACPVLRPAVDASDVPACIKGATRAPDFAWESPVPFSAPIRDMAGLFVDKLWVLDGFGNILHDDLGTWSYELRPTPGKEARALAHCVGSNVVAVGEAGTAYVRTSGWQEESVGAAVSLSAVACSSTLQAVAVGQSSSIYVRDRGQRGAWREAATSDGPYNAVAMSLIMDTAWLVGPRGLVVRCGGLASPPTTCAVEDAGTIQDLNAVWYDAQSGRVFAVGAHGAAVSRGTLGTWAPLPLAGDRPDVTLTRVGGFHAGGNYEPELVIVGASGALWTSSQTPLATASLQRAAFTALFVLDDGRTFIGDERGLLRFTTTPTEPYAEPPRVIAGEAPITETLMAVTGLGRGELFAVGAEGGRYRRWQRSWVPDNAGVAISHGLTAVMATGDGQVYAAGGTKVYVRRQGLWSLDFDAPRPVRGLAAGADRLYAVGDDGLWMEKLRAGTESWSAVDAGTNLGVLHGVAVVPATAGRPEEVVAAGDGCLALSKVGSDFRRLDVGPCRGAPALTAVAAKADGTLVLGGEVGLFLERQPGATSFTEDWNFGPESWVPLSALVPTDDGLWAVYFDGDVYRRVGSTWAEYMPATTWQGFYGAWADDRDGVFFVGSGGSIWRRPPPP